MAIHWFIPSGNDPFYLANPTENNARKNYYPNAGVPDWRCDGGDIPTTTGDAIANINFQLPIPAPVWMHFDKSIEGQTLRVRVTTVSNQNFSGNYVIQIVLLDHYTYLPNAPNGNPNFYGAMHKFYPNAQGQPYTVTAGDTVRFNASFTLNPAWALNDLDIISFIQNNDNYYMMQAHAEHVTSTTIPQFNVILMNPVTPPVIIPSQGGNFNFNVGAINHGPTQTPFAVWAKIKNPDGTWTNPTLGPVTINPPLAVPIIRMRTQSVPAQWPAGQYLYYAYTATTYPVVVDSLGFNFTKSTTGNCGPTLWEAACTGEPFPGEELTTGDFHPSSFILHPSFPNPFNPTTDLRYQIPEARNVSLRVYDTAGRLVATLADGWREAGTHQVKFDGSRLASGIYLAKLQAGDFNAVQKLVLMK